MSLKQFKTEEPTNLAIKKRHTDILASINADSIRSAQILTQIRQSNKELSRINADFVANKAENDRLVKFIESKKATIKKINEDIGSLSVKEKEKIALFNTSIKQLEKNADIQKLVVNKKIKEYNEELIKGELILKGQSDEITKRESIKNSLDKAISDRQLALSVMDSCIEKMKKEIDIKQSLLNELNQLLETLATVKDDYTKFKKERDDLENQIIIIKDDILKSERKLKALDEEIAHRFEVIGKKEEEIKKKENIITEENIALDEKKQRIIILGNTLQKHLDKQNIPIKVFN